MRTSLILMLVILVPLSAGAWGEKGHLMVNRLAIEAAGPQLPPFMAAATEQLVYNGYEPDRWREESTSPMHAAQAPDHFFDSEYWGDIATIERDRYAFMTKVNERKVELSRIGYLPYAIIENYGRLVNAFRLWRRAQTPEARESARANAVFYAGLMGHYVADAGQPMHMSIHYNGWADDTPNPNNFTKDRTLHSRYETAYVNAAIEPPIVRPLVRSPQRLPDVFDAIKRHLIAGFGELEPMYEMEKTGEFNPESPRPQGTLFIAAEIARAATMLSNLWYTAWLESAEPVPPRQ